MENPLVSIAIPSYNHEKYIGLAIESVMQQTYKNVELIVIDDGSKDKSVEKIEELGKRYNFKFISRENKSLPVTLNECLSLAKGTFFCEFSSDDIMFDDYIEQQVIFMQNNLNIGMAGAKVEIIDENGERFDRNFVSNRRAKFLYSGKSIPFNKVYRSFNLPAPGMFFRKTELEKINGFLPEIKLEDLQVQYRLAANSVGIAGNKNAKLFYRMHRTNTGGDPGWMHHQLFMTVNMFKNHAEWSKIRKFWYIKLFRDLLRWNRQKAEEFLPNVKCYWCSPKVWRCRFDLWKNKGK